MRASSLAEQLFDDLSLPESRQEPVRPASIQSRRSGPALDSPGGAAGAGATATGGAWHLRTESGETHRFESLAALQAWLHGRNDTEGYQVSRDNVTWKGVAALSDVATPPARPVLADLGSKPLVAPSIPTPPPGAVIAVSGKIGLKKKADRKQKKTWAVLFLGFVAGSAVGAHVLHFTDVADLSSVFPWLDPKPPKHQARPTAVARTAGNDARAGQRVRTVGALDDAGQRATQPGVPLVAATDAGLSLAADAGATKSLDGGLRAQLADAADAGVVSRTGPPELPIPKDAHKAFDAAKKLAEIKQWSDVVRFLEFAKASIHNNRGLLKLLAKAYDATGRKKEAARINEKFRRQDLLARANSFLKTNPQRALVEFRELQETYKNMPEAYLGEARAQQALGNDEAAKKAMDKYRALSR